MVIKMTTQNDQTIKELENKVIALQEENKRLKAHQVDIQKAKELYLGILEDFPALIWRANTDKLCDYFNSTWLEFTGRTMEQEYGNGWAEGVHPDDLQYCIEIYTSNFDKHQPFSMEYRLKNKEGDYRWILDIGQPYFDIDDTFLGYIGSCYDITEKRENEDRLKVLVITDTLTQVSNRLKLDSELETEISRAKRYNTPLSTILIDVDDFKNVNDSYGHQVGDLVLFQIAQLLKANIRNTDTLGRWGGEEFLIICPGIDKDEACALAEKLRDEIGKHTFPKVEHKTCSFGVSSFEDNDCSNTLIHKADNALYLAKQQGKNLVKEC